MFLFGGFNYGDILSAIDTLVYKRKYGDFLGLINNLTVKELVEILNMIQSKENEAALNGAMEAGGGQRMSDEDLTPEMIRALQA